MAAKIDYSFSFLIAENVTCKEGSFKCTSGECVPIEDRCDFKMDCFDGFDELNCGIYFTFNDDYDAGRYSDDDDMMISGDGVDGGSGGNGILMKKIAVISRWIVLMASMNCVF